MSKEIERYIRFHYGNLVTAGEITPSDGGWLVKLKVDYPRVFTDDKTQERTIRFLPIGQVGSLLFASNFKVKKSSSRETCGKRIASTLDKLVRRSERIVVQASAKRLAKVAIVREALNPIYVMTDHLLDHPSITSDELRGLTRPNKFRQYLSLLEEIAVVERKEDVFVQGPAFSELEGQAIKEGGTRAEQEQLFEELLIAYILSKRYDTIREVFRISRMQTYVHADNSYYGASLEAQKLLHQNENSLFSRYTALYGFKSPLRLRPVLKELVRVGAMDHDGTHYFGVTELFDEMQAIKAQMPLVDSVVA